MKGYNKMTWIWTPISTQLWASQGKTWFETVILPMHGIKSCLACKKPHLIYLIPNFQAYIYIKYFIYNKYNHILKYNTYI